MGKIVTNRLQKTPKKLLKNDNFNIWVTVLSFILIFKKIHVKINTELRNNSSGYFGKKYRVRIAGI